MRLKNLFLVNKNKNIFIYGAGEAGIQLSKVLLDNESVDIKGFIDDDPFLHDGIVNGIPVFNPIHIKKLIRKYKVKEIYLALPSILPNRYGEIINRLIDLNVHLKTLPRIKDIYQGKVTIKDIKEVTVDDLLSRLEVAPDLILLNKNIKNRTVLVTGAGGSIGSELCKQILNLEPQELIILDHSEFALYEVNRKLREYTNIKIYPILASVTDKKIIEKIIKKWRPSTIYHAAAYKHVPLVESNIISSINNNVWGTLYVANAAAKYDVENFILISTDKAVRPTSIMGASKRLAELVLQAFASQKMKTSSAEMIATCFSMVRFGNVLGSSGSVIPLFKEQIQNGGPVTVSHLDVTRYFMTIKEASELVIQAGAMARGGEVFVLDMGEPIRIYDLAVKMIELSGLKLGKKDGGNIDIEITGLKTGEKLYEELLINNNPVRSSHPKIFVSKEEFIDWDDLKPLLKKLKVSLNKYDINTVSSLLQRIVGNYSCPNKIVDLIYEYE